MMLPYEYRGAVHVHSRYSDGSATVEEILVKAQRTGLDFVMLTDHNTLAAREQGYEGWYGSTLLLVGNEISPRAHHHYLAFGLDEALNGRDYADPREFVREVAQRGGLGIIAHPFGDRSRYFGLKPASWKAWDIDQYDGIEIWSYMVDWVEHIAPWSSLYYYCYPERAIRGPHPDTLRQWDTVAQRRRVIGIGSIDAHGLPLMILRFIKILPYEFLFRTIRTHILLEKPLDAALETAQEQVYAAIRQGRCFIGYDALADTTGFRLEADGGALQMGDERPWERPVEIEVWLPVPAAIRLLRDGKLVAQVQGKHLRHRAKSPGVYRVEVYLQGSPWIFSNPLFLR